MMLQQVKSTDPILLLDENRKQLEATAAAFPVSDPQCDAVMETAGQLRDLMMTVPAKTKEGIYAKLRQYFRYNDVGSEDDMLWMLIDELAQFCSGSTSSVNGNNGRSPDADIVATYDVWRQKHQLDLRDDDDANNARLDDCRVLERRVTDTPATTPEGLAVKIILLAEFMEDDANGLTETDLLLSAAKDARNLLGRVAS